MGWGRGGDIGRARDLRALCTTPTPGCPSQPPLSNLQNQLGPLEDGREDRVSPGKRLAIGRRGRGGGAIYTTSRQTRQHEVEKSTNRRKRKRGVVCLEQSWGLSEGSGAPVTVSSQEARGRGGTGGRAGGDVGGVWTSWGAVSVTGAWASLRPPSPSPPPRRRKGRGRSNRSGAPARGGRHSEDRGDDCPRVQGPHGGCRGTTVLQPKTRTFFKQKNAGKGHLFDLQDYCRTGCSNMLVAMETDLH